MASTPPAVVRFVFFPPAACASDGPFFPPAFFSQWSPTFSKECFTAAHATWLARFSSPYSFAAESCALAKVRCAFPHDPKVMTKSTLKGQGSATHEEINLIGTSAEVIDKALAFKEAGVTHLLGLYFAANSVPELLDQMQLFAEEVMPKVK